MPHTGLTPKADRRKKIGIATTTPPIRLPKKDAPNAVNKDDRRWAWFSMFRKIQML
jgi:hypothetical protein